MHIYIINLASAEQRLHFQQQQMQKLNLNYEILPATSVKEIDEETYNKYSQDWQRPLKRTELACYFSHRQAWQGVIARGKPSLILEDDALLSNLAPELLSRVENRTVTDLINLEVRSRKKMVARTGEDTGCQSQLFRLYQDRTGSAGYILWPSGAHKLLQHEKKNGIALTDAHVTTCHSLIAYQVEPAVITQLDQLHYYNIESCDISQIAKTSVSAVEHDKGGTKFRLRRIIAQITLGFRQLRLSSKATRRYIHLQKDDFTYD